MKKLIFGIGMLNAGVIGFAGWIIACAINNDGMPGLKIFETLNGGDLLITVIFVIMILAGLFVSFFEIKKE